MKRFLKLYTDAWVHTGSVRVPIAVLWLAMSGGAAIVAVSFHVPLSYFAARSEAGRAWMSDLNMSYVNEFLIRHDGWTSSWIVQSILLIGVVWLAYTWYSGGVVARLAGSQGPFHIHAGRCFWPILRLGFISVGTCGLILPAAFFGTAGQIVMLSLWLMILMASDIARARIARGSTRAAREFFFSFAELRRATVYRITGYGLTGFALAILYVGLDALISYLGRESSWAVGFAFVLSQMFVWARLMARAALWSWTLRISSVQVIVPSGPVEVAVEK